MINNSTRCLSTLWLDFRNGTRINDLHSMELKLHACLFEAKYWSLKGVILSFANAFLLWQYESCSFSSCIARHEQYMYHSPLGPEAYPVPALYTVDCITCWTYSRCTESPPLADIGTTVESSVGLFLSFHLLFFPAFSTLVPFFC